MTAPEPSAAIELEGVARRFGEVVAVRDVSLTIREGEFFSLLGPSGCGKTTLLRMVAGFEWPDAGRILLQGEDMTRRPPNKRAVNTVFQSYELFPHMSVADNVAYGLRVQRVPKAQRAERVSEMLEIVASAASKGAGPISCRAARSSAWRWLARWSTSPACCCSTNRCQRWT